MKHTKIVCTMGPQENDPVLMRQLFEAGMDVARFNFSHGTHEEQLVRMNTLRQVRKETGRPVAMLLDTKGPEIRTGRLKDGQPVMLVKGETITLTTEQIEGDASRVSVSYNKLPQDVKKGNTILVDDGLISLIVEDVTGSEIVCRIENGGKLGQQKGINLPGIKTHLPALTQQDINDILFGIEEEFDIIAASFIRNAAGVNVIKALLAAQNSNIPVYSKIECAEAIENIDEIIEASDGIMVARGDLGVEVPAWKVPHYQKMIIEKCNKAYKPVITATQMLESMTHSPRPTRAEVTDVANAIYDGTDAVMLSGETAVGEYPVEAVKMMAEIAESTEEHINYERSQMHRAMEEKNSISSAVCIASVRTARNVKADYIIIPTQTGYTARLMSNFRPEVPVFGVSPSEKALRRMMIYWGVVPVRGAQEKSRTGIINHAIDACKRDGFIKARDRVIVTAGDPVNNVIEGVGSVTNMMYVVEVK